MIIRIVLLNHLCSIVVLAAQKTFTVQTQLGPIEGLVHTLTVDQSRSYDVYSFLGVPYAMCSYR
jgi:hypothetical protein